MNNQDFVYVNTEHLNEKELNEYYERKKQIIKLTEKYEDKTRNFPQIEYVECEIETWNKVFTRLNELYPIIACDSYLYGIEEFKKNHIFRLNHIPNLKEVSDFLESRTGFRLYPISGLLSPNQFLQGLASNVFYCTQYIRHSSRPFYTPEPDIIHEMLGHAPMFLDENVCEISRMIGKSALVCSENKIYELERLYWFTIEFGVIKNNNNGYKVYGAGLLSSADEMEKINKGTKIEHFDLEKIVSDQPLITEFQTHYYWISSLEELKNCIRKYLRIYLD
jgi:phenylalanine-4-hydroxylase